MNRKMLKAAMLAAAVCLGTLAAPALAQVNISIDIGAPPPPARAERHEAPRPGYVLLPGYWFWDGHQHRWADQRWAKARPGQHWQAERWEKRGGKHHFEPGRWEADRHEGRDEAHDRGNNKGPGRGHGDN
jgi:hypothetical protein